MGKSQRIRHQDLRGIHRVVSDVRDARRDSLTMNARLIDGLIDLVGGTCGFACEVANWRPGGDLRISALTPDSRSDGAIAELIRGLSRNNNLWDDPSFVEGVRQTGMVESIPFHQLIPETDFARTYPLFNDIKHDVDHVDHLIAWHRIGPGRPDVQGLAVHRWGKGQRRFGRRETEVARVLFEELNWLYASGRLEPTALEFVGLPPRLAEVLDLLRAGQAPKQIARQLGLSVHTVRDHVKRLYARAGVGDRGAFMALLTGGKTPGNGLGNGGPAGGG